MGELSVNILGAGNALEQVLTAQDIVPGDEIGYQTAKTIFLWHPLGLKMAASPIMMAQSQPREIAVTDAPDDVLAAFVEEWADIGADDHILNLMTQTRVYGVSTIVCGAEGVPTKRPLDPWALAGAKIYINVLDPLNTSGSLVGNQNPNSPDFQKHQGVTVQGQQYHRSRCCVMMNERPIYIAWTGSAFGYVGRSVYQRALFPLRSFVNTMIADDMLAKKAGLMIAKMEMPSSAWDNVMARVFGMKRGLLKAGETNNVLTISVKEAIETLNMTNAKEAIEQARRDILENIAVSADMPAKLLNSETFAEGFGEGTEDAKNIARYIDRKRIEMKAPYDFFDNIVQYRAWNREFYATIQTKYPEKYGNMGYRQAFMRWHNSFKAEWPSLLIEPESEQAKAEDVKLKAIIATVQVMLPAADPENKARILQWAADNINENKIMFQTPLDLDTEAMANYTPPQIELGEDQVRAPKPFGATA